MNHCLLHPQSEAAGACEYCAQPHCGQCLRSLLGRRYCPGCYQQVEALASGATRRTYAPGSAEARPTPAAAGPREARLPGWVSAAVYLIVWLALGKFLAEGVLVVPLLIAKALSAKVPLDKAGDPSVLMDPSGLGLPLWCVLWAVVAWGSLLATIAVTAALGRWIERRTLTDLGLGWRPTIGRDLVLGLALATALFVSVVGVGAAQNLYYVRSSTSAVDALGITVVGFLLLLPLAAVEEISLRGYVLQAVSRSWGAVGGVAVSTLAFVLLHALNPGFREHPLTILGLLLAGLYLASAYLITRNLWLAIFLHTGWNLLEGPIFGLPVSGIRSPETVLETTATGPALWTGGAFGPEAGLLLCLLMIVHLAALWVMSPLLRPQPPEEPPAGGEPRPEPAEPKTYRAIPVGGR